MKISRKDLPESIAEALKPRTFAQERPEDGQRIEVQHDNRWFKATMHKGGDHPDWLGSKSLPCSYWVNDLFSNLWRPVLEIEDEAPEPERALPEPGSYFISQNQLAMMSIGGDMWGVCSTESGHCITPYHAPLSDIPDNWQSLSDLIAKAARCDDVEKELLQEQYARRHWEESSDANFARVEELEAELAALKETESSLFCGKEDLRGEVLKLQAKIKQQDAEIKAGRTVSSGIVERNREVRENIAQQDALLDLADNFVFRNAHGRICTDDTNVVELLDGLDARRKAREASE